MFENYISEKKAKDNYITYLSRIHVEMLTFKPRLEDRLVTMKHYDSLRYKMFDNITSQKYEDLAGYTEIEYLEPRDLNTDIFRSLNNEFFLNHNLYSELYSFYSDIDEIINLSKLKKEKIQEIYSTYNLLRLKNGIVDNNELNELIIQYNDLTTYQSSIPIKNKITTIKIGLEKLIKQIEAEVKSFDKNIDEFKTFEDFLTLSSSFYYSCRCCNNFYY